jgi:histidine triad (HIT) family protein
MDEQNCLFCRIIRGEVPALKVHEDEHVIAFLDVHPLAPGHTMVVPKRHFATLAQLPLEEATPLMLAVQSVARRVVEAMEAPGVTIGINQGEVSGQTIPHLHIHILPRFEGDGGGSVHSVVHNPPVEELQKTVERINNIK